MIPSPDSPAQIYIQAAEHLQRFGALAPFEIVSPLLPILIATLGTITGIRTDWAYAALVAVIHVSGCIGLFLLVDRWQLSRQTALTSALLLGVAPSRVFAVFEEWDGSRLLFWSLIPFVILAADAARRSPRLGKLAGLLALLAALAGSQPLRFGFWDLLAAGELVALVGVSLAPSRVRLAWGQYACMVFFLAILGWKFWVEPQLRFKTHAPRSLASWIERRSDRGRVFSPVWIEAQSNPILAQARQVILGEGREKESLLWLRAIAVEYVVSDDWRKFHAALECAYEQAGWCVYRFPAPNAAEAVIVSSQQWETLHPVRGLWDVQGLEAYLAWAGRPEAAGMRWLEGHLAEVRANLGPVDMLLIRVNHGPDWRAYLHQGEHDWRPIPLEADPLGYIAINPHQAGDIVVRLKYEPPWWRRVFPRPVEGPVLETGAYPAINADGVADAADYSSSPFAAGATLTIFGENFVPERTRVLFSDRPGELLWTSPNQINVQAPKDLATGVIEVVVESDGRRSYPEIIEIKEGS